MLEKAKIKPTEEVVEFTVTSTSLSFLQCPYWLTPAEGSIATFLKG